MRKQVENRIVEVKVGSVVQHEAGRVEKLLPCEWEGAPFRWPHPFERFPAMACNVHITGRSFQYRCDSWWVRIRLEFVGDGEPSTSAPAWLKVDLGSLPYAYDQDSIPVGKMLRDAFSLDDDWKPKS